MPKGTDLKEGCSQEDTTAETSTTARKGVLHPNGGVDLYGFCGVLGRPGPWSGCILKRAQVCLQFFYGHLKGRHKDGIYHFCGCVKYIVKYS